MALRNKHLLAPSCVYVCVCVCGLTRVGHRGVEVHVDVVVRGLGPVGEVRVLRRVKGWDGQRIYCHLGTTAKKHDKIMKRGYVQLY